MRYGPTRVIGPGATAVLPLELPPNRIRGDRYETTVFLYHPSVAGGDDPVRGLFRDGNNADNEYRVSFPFDRPRRYDVLATLEQLEIFDDCDNVSPGDWYVHYTISEVRGDVVVQQQETYWPDREHPIDIDSGSTRRLDRILRLTSVHPDSHLLIAVSAIDCDADSPFAWGITIPWGGIPSFVGALNLAGNCSGEEIWEASGEHDRVGTHFFAAEPEEWLASPTAALHRTDYTRHECSDSPSHAFNPTVRVEASLR